MKIGIAPLHHAVAAGIEFLSSWAHGDTNPVLIDGSIRAGLTRVVRDQDFIVRADTVTLTAHWANVNIALGNQITATRDAWIALLWVRRGDFGPRRTAAVCGTTRAGILGKQVAQAFIAGYWLAFDINFSTNERT